MSCLFIPEGICKGIKSKEEEEEDDLVVDLPCHFPLPLLLAKNSFAKKHKNIEEKLKLSSSSSSHFFCFCLVRVICVSQLSCLPCLISCLSHFFFIYLCFSTIQHHPQKQTSTVLIVYKIL